MSHLPPAYPLVGSAPTTLKPPPTTLPGHTLRPANPLVGSVPTTRKPPSTTLPGHTYTTLKSRTWREEKRESHRVEKARKGGRTKNTNAGQ